MYESLIYPSLLGCYVATFGLAVLIWGYEENLWLSKNRNKLLIPLKFLGDLVIFSLCLLIGLTFIVANLTLTMFGLLFKINQTRLENKYNDKYEQISVKPKAEDTEKMLYFYQCFFSKSGYDRLEKESDITLSRQNRDNYKLDQILEFEKSTEKASL